MVLAGYRIRLLVGAGGRISRLRQVGVAVVDALDDRGGCPDHPEQPASRCGHPIGVLRDGPAEELGYVLGVVTQATTGSTRVVQARLHDSSIRTTETYARLPIDDYRAAVGEVAAVLRRG